MEEKTQPAEFSFNNFQVLNAEFKISKLDEMQIGVGFDVSGIFYPSKSRYDLLFNAVVSDDKNKEVFLVRASLVASFGFKHVSVVEEIPDYFYQNCLAIVYPYFRAYVSSITTLGNWEPLILPLLNLSKLSETLITKTTIAEN